MATVEEKASHECAPWTRELRLINRDRARGTTRSNLLSSRRHVSFSFHSPSAPPACSGPLWKRSGATRSWPAASPVTLGLA